MSDSKSSPPPSATSRKRRGRGEGGAHYDARRKLWVASVSLGYFPDGRRNRPVAYGKTKREALDELDRLRREAGHRGGVAPLTVSELLDLWLEAKRGHVAEHTDEQRTDASVRVKAAPFAAAAAASLTPLDVTRWHAAMAKAGVAPAPRWHAARALSGCLAHAVGLGVLPSNPAKAAGLPALPGRDMVVLSPGQARALLAAARGYVAGPLIAVALGSGLRQGEQLGLFWEDVDLKAGTLSVKRALVRTRAKGFHLKKTKTKAARRTVCLPGFAVDALRELRSSREGWPAAWTVFCAPHGAHRHRARLSSHLKKAVARANATAADGGGAGIPDGYRWHDQRHTHASLLLSAGYSIRAVSARLGHASPAFTLRQYAHLLPGDDERLAQGMQNILG